MNEEFSTEENEHMNMVFTAFTLCNLLEENGKDINDPNFINILKELKPSISALEMIDFDLHKEQFDEMLKSYEDSERYAVLFKSAFTDAKLGDKINGGIVIGIFLFTIWIYKDPETGHKYCCENCNCE